MKGYTPDEMLKREKEWDHRFLSLADHIKEWSKDPSTKVGAVIIDELKVVRSMGYNGFPRGVDDSPERYADRSLKYPRVVHAELNAILNIHSRTRDEEFCLYTTLAPCAECAKAIIQAGVYRVVTWDPIGLDKRTFECWNSDIEITKSMFNEADVELDFL